MVLELSSLGPTKFFSEGLGQSQGTWLPLRSVPCVSPSHAPLAVLHIELLYLYFTLRNISFSWTLWKHCKTFLGPGVGGGGWGVTWAVTTESFFSRTVLLSYLLLHPPPPHPPTGQIYMFLFMYLFFKFYWSIVNLKGCDNFFFFFFFLVSSQVLISIGVLALERRLIKCTECDKTFKWHAGLAELQGIQTG